MISMNYSCSWNKRLCSGWVWWQQPGSGVSQFLLARRLRLSTQRHARIDWQPRSDVVLHAEVAIIQLTGNQWLPYGRSVSILASQSHEILLHDTHIVMEISYGPTHEGALIFVWAGQAISERTMPLFLKVKYVLVKEHMDSVYPSWLIGVGLTPAFLFNSFGRHVDSSNHIVPLLPVELMVIRRKACRARTFFVVQ